MWSKGRPSLHIVHRLTISVYNCRACWWIRQLLLTHLTHVKLAITPHLDSSTIAVNSTQTVLHFPIFLSLIHLYPVLRYIHYLILIKRRQLLILICLWIILILEASKLCLYTDLLLLLLEVRHAKTHSELVREIGVCRRFPVGILAHVIHAWAGHRGLLRKIVLVWCFLNPRVVICKQVCKVASPAIVARKVLPDGCVFDDAEGHGSSSTEEAVLIAFWVAS